MSEQFGTPQEWQKIIDDDFEVMVKMLRDIKDSLKGVDYVQQVNFYKPMQYQIMGASIEAASHKRQIREAGEDILGGLGL